MRRLEVGSSTIAAFITRYPSTDAAVMAVTAFLGPRVVLGNCLMRRQPHGVRSGRCWHGRPRAQTTTMFEISLVPLLFCCLPGPVVPVVAHDLLRGFPRCFELGAAARDEQLAPLSALAISDRHFALVPRGHGSSREGHLRAVRSRPRRLPPSDKRLLEPQRLSNLLLSILLAVDPPSPLLPSSSLGPRNQEGALDYWARWHGNLSGDFIQDASPPPPPHYPPPPPAHPPSLPPTPIAAVGRGLNNAIGNCHF
eukprot:9477276-Pyramimonas_sp.AAC.2